MIRSFIFILNTPLIKKIYPEAMQILLWIWAGWWWWNTLRLITDVQFCSFLNQEALQIVPQALITLQMDYCNAFYVVLFLKTMKQVHFV